MIQDHEHLPPPLPGPLQEATPGADLPENTQVGLWHWVSPEEESEQRTRELREVVLACVGMLLPMCIGLVLSRQYDALFRFMFSPVGFIFGAVICSNIRHSPNRRHELRAYQVGDKVVHAVGDPRRPLVDLLKVRKVLVWREADGTPKGIALKTGWFRRENFWGLTDMPHFVSAVLAELSSTTPISYRALRAPAVYRRALVATVIFVAPCLFVGGLLPQPLGTALGFLPVFAFLSVTALLGLYDPRRPSF